MTDLKDIEPVYYRHLISEPNEEEDWELFDPPTGSDCEWCEALYTAQDVSKLIAQARHDALMEAADNHSVSDGDWDDYLRILAQEELR